MNRELKFRVWDTKQNEWMGESDPNTLKYYGFHLFGEVMAFQSVPPEYYQHMIVEQFTGFQDKYGKDIYEGDILFIPGITPRPSNHYEVLWQDGAFKIETNKNPFMRTFNPLLSMYAGVNDIDLIVIGNIHEDQELLKENK